MAISFNNEIIWTSFDIAKLTMKDLSESDIEEYVKKDKPFKSCGSYKYELNGKDLFSKIEGSIYTIQGLDIDTLLIYLRQNKFI
jgi:septum formation protein